MKRASCAQHGDMICLTRCLTVDLLPPHVGQSGEILQQKSLSLNFFVLFDRDKTPELVVLIHIKLKWYHKLSPLL